MLSIYYSIITTGNKTIKNLFRLNSKACVVTVWKVTFLFRDYTVFFGMKPLNNFFFVNYLQKIFAQLNYVRISESAQSVTE